MDESEVYCDVTYMDMYEYHDYESIQVNLNLHTMIYSCMSHRVIDRLLVVVSRVILPSQVANSISN